MCWGTCGCIHSSTGAYPRVEVCSGFGEHQPQEKAVVSVVLVHSVLVEGTVFATWQVLTVKCVGKKRRRENRENCQILRSSSEFTKCKGIQRILSPSVLSALHCCP